MTSPGEAGPPPQRDDTPGSRPAPPPPAPGVLGRADAWIAAHQPAVIIPLLIISVALRLVCFAQMQGGPLLVQHRWDQSDMAHFDDWARAIADGDWLSARVDPPFHAWHAMIAAEHFRLDPEDRARIDRALADRGEPVTDDAAARALWDRWCGGGRFYQDPLYPYLLGATWATLGHDVRWAFAWQMALGVLSTLLVYLVSRRAFGPLVATVAGALAALYGPMLFHELVLLRDSTIVFASLLVVWLVGLGLDRARPATWGLAGLATGLSLALKFHFLLLVPMVLLGLVASGERRWKGLARSALPYGAGVVLGFAPVLARNIALGVPTEVTGGAPTFAVMNGPNATGTSWDVGNAAAILGPADGRFLPTVLGTLRAHPDAASVLGLLGNKVEALWHWYELPNNENFYYYRLHLFGLRLSFVTFRAVAPLALVGLALSLWRLRRSWPLWTVVLTHAATILVVVPFARYRVPLAAVLVPFAALAVCTLAERLVSRRWLGAVLLSVAVVLIAVWTAAPLSSTTTIRAVDCGMPIQLHYRPMLEASAARGDWEQSARTFAEILRFQPKVVEEMRRGRTARNGREAGLARLFADVFEQYGRTLQLAGRNESATGPLGQAEALRRAALGPGAPDADG